MRASPRRDDFGAYRLGPDVQTANDFSMAMTTDFDAIDFPPQTLLPTTEARGAGWRCLSPSAGKDAVFCRSFQGVFSPNCQVLPSLF